MIKNLYKINHIYNNLDLLENKHVYEVDPVPGIQKCETMAKRMREDFDLIVKALEEKQLFANLYRFL